MDYETWLKGLENYKKHLKETNRTTTLEDLLWICIAGMFVDNLEAVPEETIKKDLAKHIELPPIIPYIPSNCGGGCGDCCI